MLTWPLAASLDGQALWAEGHTYHQRLRPKQHGFRYPVVFWLLPMRARAASAKSSAWRALARGWFQFKDTDHGVGGSDARAWAEDALAQDGIVDYLELWLLCMPRVAGYAFKPVSFWFAVNHQRAVVAVLAEVNNTFGERHGYLIDQPVTHGATQAPNIVKHFYVSPFFAVEGHYQFRFTLEERALRIAVDLHDATGPVLHTGIRCALEPFADRPTWQRVLRHPLFSFSVLARIHWQAFNLWRKGVRLAARPEPPRIFISK